SCLHGRAGKAGPPGHGLNGDTRGTPMTQPSPPTPPTGSAVQARLQELARVLRHTNHLDPEAQQAIADLLAELSQSLHPGWLSWAETTQLVENTAQLAEALRQGQPAGPLQAARKRLERAVLRAEAKAPLLTGIVGRLLDALANIGI